ncbi:hypothetical protein GCM10010521_48390 [Streptomyces rameus]|uniref:Uncharacterized protein n=1 Tax=Streptomyces rameus TaxID=68261 RepID=A0ABP6NPB7_9ACTN
MIVLAIPRHDQRVADLADLSGGNNISESTVRRRLRDELISLLAAQAARLDRALSLFLMARLRVTVVWLTDVHESWQVEESPDDVSQNTGESPTKEPRVGRMVRQRHRS